MSASRRLIHAGVVGLLVVGCGTVPLEGLQTPALSARAEYRIVAGNSGIIWYVEVDSTSALFQTVCTAGARAPASCEGSSFPSKRGSLARAQVKQLFADASSRAFKALKAEYDMSGTYVDGPAYSVTVTTNGTTRAIRWSDAAKLPDALSRFAWSIQAVTGTGR